MGTFLIMFLAKNLKPWQINTNTTSGECKKGEKKLEKREKFC